MNIYKENKGVALALLAASIISLSGCTDEKETNDVGRDAQNDAIGAVLARSFINNGYYVSQMNSYNEDGLLDSESVFVIDYDANTITEEITGDFVSRIQIYSYDSSGDLIATSVSSIDSSENATVPTDLGGVSTVREDGLLIESMIDFAQVGADDQTSVYMYNSDGTISRVETTYSSGFFEFQDFNYEDGLLVSVVGNDVDTPDTTVTKTFTYDAQGLLTNMTTDFGESLLSSRSESYEYDANGNIAAIVQTLSNGAVNFREEYLYELASEPVFNLAKMGVYYP